MPSMAPRACRCGRIQPCPTHRRKPRWDHAGRSRQARGYNAEYERNRAIVMREESICHHCGGPGLPNDEADHLTALAAGGTNDRANLRRAHRRCNLARARARNRVTT